MRRVLLLAASVALPLTALAQQGALPAPTTPREFHKMREARMGQGGRALAGLTQAADSGAELSTQAERVAILTRLAADLPGFFPAGSGGEATEARPEIWSDPAGFQSAIARFDAGARALASAAAAGDRTAFVSALTETRAACGACHDAYRD